MRINSPESIRRARELLQKYGSYENIGRAMRLHADIRVAQTPIRMTTRPVICPETNGITFEVGFLKDTDQLGFFMLRLGGYTVNGETLDNRNPMISEDTVRKKSLFRKAIYRYRLFMRCTDQNRAFAEKAQAEWDRHEKEINKGYAEVLICLPTVGEGPGKGKRGYSRGSIKAQPSAQAKGKR